jgi:hypothetical protein
VSKLLDTIEAREASRARVLELRRVAAEKDRLYRQTHTELAELAGQERRECARLVQLTTDVAQLLHADLTGIVGKRDSDAAPAPTAPTPSA